MQFVADGFTFHIDPDTLRDSCDEPERLSAFCEENPSLPITVSYLRILGRLPEAEERGRALVEASPAPLQRAAAVARLAHVLQWQDRYTDALDLFDEALATDGLDDNPDLAAQIHQHRAKCRLDADDVAGARTDAQTALELRASAGADDDTLRSTLLLLSQVHRADAKPRRALPPLDESA